MRQLGLCLEDWLSTIVKILKKKNQVDDLFLERGHNHFLLNYIDGGLSTVLTQSIVKGLLGTSLHFELAGASSMSCFVSCAHNRLYLV